MTSHASHSPWVLVTGAAGFIGFHLIESLLRDNYAVVGIDNFDDSYAKDSKASNVEDLRQISQQTHAPFRFHSKDVADLTPADLSDVPVSAVIHLAARDGAAPSMQSPGAFLHTNVKGTLRLLEFCRARLIDKFLFASSASIYGMDSILPFREDCKPDRPMSPYAASKRAGELYCQSYAHLYGMRVAMLRLFSVYGPRQRPGTAVSELATLIADRKIVTINGDGNSCRDFTYVSDIVNGFRSALSWLHTVSPATCEAFNLGAGRSTSLIGLVRLLEKGLGITAETRFQDPLPGEVTELLADLSKSGKYLAYTPQVPIEQGMARFLEWFSSDASTEIAA